MAKAPDFSLPDQNGDLHSLKDYAGKWLVLYFYPKDDTPGCTNEACGFRDGREVIAELGNVEVVGISKDTIASHRRFAEKYGLHFTLLSDPEHATIEAYGAWKPKKFMGREFLGIHRNTVIIAPDGQIAQVFEGVDPKTHVGEVVEALKKLQT
ncbi:MAG TPA: thioredoxin-dependent thiol peroxidase [Candidatus Saccharimonadales bacterium]|nr:thioredoxin-dependent thiol peroxidase [Candidatus Saccharimonadales bacterium]